MNEKPAKRSYLAGVARVKEYPFCGKTWKVMHEWREHLTYRKLLSGESSMMIQSTQSVVVVDVVNLGLQ